MKKALAVLLAAAVVCTAAFLNLTFLTYHPIKDFIPIEAEDVLAIDAGRIFHTQDEEEIREIMEYIYAFRYVACQYLPDAGSQPRATFHLKDGGEWHIKILPEAIYLGNQEKWYFAEDPTYFQHLIEKMQFSWPPPWG